MRFVLLPVSLAIVPLLGWMIIEPFYRQWRQRRFVPPRIPRLPLAVPQGLAARFDRIAIAVDTSDKPNEENEANPDPAPGLEKAGSVSPWVVDRGLRTWAHRSALSEIGERCQSLMLDPACAKTLCCCGRSSSV